MKLHRDRKTEDYLKTKADKLGHLFGTSAARVNP